MATLKELGSIFKGRKARLEHVATLKEVLADATLTTGEEGVSHPQPKPIMKESPQPAPVPSTEDTPLAPQRRRG